MPIEIRELVIRARVEEQPSGHNGPASASAGSTSPAAQPDIQQIVAICTEEVMRLLKKQNER